MLPAQQIESGTTAAAVSLDEPGIFYIPRVNAQVTHGLGGGDLTVTLGGPPGGAGLTGRYYLTEQETLELQVQGTRIDGSWSGLALVGIQEVPTGRDSWYIGGQFGTINGRAPLFGGVRRTAPVAGGSIGYGPVEIGASTRLQVEFEANVPLAEGEGPVPATRLSIGVFRLFR